MEKQAVGAKCYSIELSFSFSIRASHFHLVRPKLKKDYHQRAFIPTPRLPTCVGSRQPSCRWLRPLQPLRVAVTRILDFGAGREACGMLLPGSLELQEHEAVPTGKRSA